MAAQRRRSVALALPAEPRRKVSPRLADGADKATASPALRQRDLLEAQWRAAETSGEPGRWSHRRTLAFIGLTCGGFWTCVALGAAQLLR